MNGSRAGDPAKLAASLVKVVELTEPPRAVGGRRRCGAGGATEGHTLIDQADAHLDLSTGLDHDDAA